LTESDLNYSSPFYVGAFKMPETLSTCSSAATANAQGITIMYESGTPYLLTQAANYCMVAFNIPALVVSGTYNTATVAKTFPDFASSKRVDQNGNTFGGTAMGIFWDEDADKLYQFYMESYNACCPNNPSMVQSTLNWAAGTGTAIGSWRFSNIGVKAVQSGALRIPDYYANTYTPGKTLGVGFGGNFSAGGTGSNSMGPTVIAVAPPNIATNPQGSALANTPLMYYDAFLATFAQAPPYRFLRGTTTPALNQQLDSWPAAYWTWDIVGSCAWPYTATKHGIVCMTNVAAGYLQYVASTVGYQQGFHRWYIMDPEAVAEASNVWSVESDSYFDVQYGSANSPPDLNYSAYPLGPASVVNVTSITRSGTTATVTTATPHGVGSQSAYITGATPSGYNGGFFMTNVNSTTFTYQVNSSLSTPATGTITVQRLMNDMPAPMSSGEASHGIGMTYDAVAERLYACVPGRPNSNSIRGVCYVWDFTE